jgi:hypothetical protein
MDFKKLTNQLGDKLREGADKLQHESEKLLAKIDLPNLGEAGQQAANETVAEFSESVPLFPEAGYRLRELEIELGLPPKAKAHFELIEVVGPDQQAAILERARALGRMSELLFTALFKANQLQNAIKLGSFKMKEIEVELGLIPSVSVKFQPTGHPGQPPLALAGKQPE